jgi:hypothetical protein
MDRRKLIVAGAGALVTTLSGCSGTDGDPSGGTTDGAPSQDGPGGDSTEETTDSGSTAKTTESGPDDDIGNYSPEDVAEQYYDAFADADATRLDDLAHPDGVAINSHGPRAEQMAEFYDLTIDRVELASENLEYFYQPSAVVEVAYEQSRKSNSTSRVTRDELVLVVDDGELLVYDRRVQNNYLRDEPPVDSCDIEDVYDLEDRLPITSESFYAAGWDESFGVWDAEYRGPDGSWLVLELGFHDSAEEAEAVEMEIGTTHSKGDTELTTDAGLLARRDTMTCVVSVASADATDQVDALYAEVGCFTEDDVVERSW